MWARAATFAFLLAAAPMGVAADEEIVVTMWPPEFWRPVSGGPPNLTIMIYRDSVTAVAPCFSTPIATIKIGGTSASNDRPMHMDGGTECGPSRADYDAFETAFRRTASVRRSGTGVSLIAADGSDLVELEPIAPEGFEFRQLTVTQFRHGGGLRPVKRLDSIPYLLFFGGQIAGTVGCGGLFGSNYRPRPGSKFEFNIASLSSMWCSNDMRSLEQARGIARAFTGERTVEASGPDFILRDAHGDAQIVLSPNIKGATP